ncbi:hypothetical protein P8452_20008 [Trifolium repens]|nr:hypothetical protein P8452_20008 [Trifolium repens]
MAYSRSFMFLGVILFVILSTQVLAANHVPELSISEWMASKKSRLMFSKSNSMTVSESLMAKENTEDRFRRHAEILLEAAKIRRYEDAIRHMEHILREREEEDGEK